MSGKDKPPASAMMPGEVHGELALEWSRDAVRRGHIRLRSPRLAELLDALAASKVVPPQLELPASAADQPSAKPPWQV
jgi:hypothetical protein